MNIIISKEISNQHKSNILTVLKKSLTISQYNKKVIIQYMMLFLYNKEK